MQEWGRDGLERGIEGSGMVGKVGCCGWNAYDIILENVFHYIA